MHSLFAIYLESDLYADDTIGNTLYIFFFFFHRALYNLTVKLIIDL